MRRADLSGKGLMLFVWCVMKVEEQVLMECLKDEVARKH